MHHMEGEENFEVRFLRNSTVDRAVLDIGQHVIVAIHRDNLDVLATSFIHSNRSTFATVAICATDANNIRVRLNGL